MRKMLKLVILAAAAYGAKAAYDNWKATQGGSTGRVGYDTPTGTDPSAKYREPGYHDKSFGQAVNQDQQLADRLARETGGDMRAAEDRLREESAGAPAIARQESTQT